MTPPLVAPFEAGVSHPLAIARAARLSDLRYDLAFSLKAHAGTTEGRETLTFSDSGSGDLALDFRDGNVRSASLNGKSIASTVLDGHLLLPGAVLVQGRNTLTTDFTANIAPAGKAITRYEDKDDGNEYLYTLFVPMDADMAFPCFDQPDLKARFRLSVEHPSGWSVVANTAVSSVTPSGANALSRFPESKPISTYLFAFAAGPFQRIGPANRKEPAVYVRLSQLERARKEVPAVQEITARGIAYLEDFFAQPFPFPKYDLVLIPGFPFGGMEHAGATFLNEDSVLFRSAPTQSDYFRRDTLVLHETTHQWFGDLVTMRWFDDLWLKEGFAQYMAYKAEAALKPETQPWKHFSEDIKPLAYGIDETQGTTPIFQQIPNLKDAKSAYGAIVYQKAPALLRQLEFRLGEENFREGLRLYLKQHAYANAQWADLIHAFEATGTQEVQTWADAWILRRGMPQVDVSWSCKEGMLEQLVLSQKDVLGTNQTWPMSNDILVLYPDVFSRASDTLRVDWSGASYPVTQAIGKPCPAAVFANAGDHAYGRFLLDRDSEAVVVQRLSRSGGHAVDDPLTHSMLWAALWEKVHVAQSAPRGYVELALKTLPDESDEAINRIQGARIATALHAYLAGEGAAGKGREALVRQAESVIADRMLHASSPGLRIVNFRTFRGIAESPAALAQLKSILTGKLRIEGLTLRPLDRWTVLGHLIAQGDPESAALLTAEQRRDRSGEAQKYAFAVQAATPDAAAKRRYFRDYLQNSGLQEDWITQSLAWFNSWNQRALTEPFLISALDELPSIKRHRKIFFLGAWLQSFIGGQVNSQAQAAVHAWLGRTDIDPDLRLKVLEASDALDRTVLIRQRFAE